MEIANYKNVRFESFAKLASMVQSGSRWYASTMLYYNGTHLYGTVTIDMNGTAKEKAEFLEFAVKTLEF